MDRGAWQATDHGITRVGYDLATKPQPPWRTVWSVLKKLKIELPNDPGIPLLGIYLKKINIVVQKDICTPMSTAALFTTSKIRKQPKCPPTE